MMDSCLFCSDSLPLLFIMFKVVIFDLVNKILSSFSH